MKVTQGDGSRDYPKFFTNSSPLDAGGGGALGSPFRFSWDQLSALPDTKNSPDGNPLLGPMFVTDSMGNAFASDNPYGGEVFAFEEAVYTIYPTYPVMLVTTDKSKKYSVSSADIYALQIVDYYTNKASGNLTLNYVNLAHASEVKTATVDARSYTGWTYFDLSAGQVSSKEGTWHLAFNRYKIITNSGASSAGTNSGKVGTYLAQKFTGFYDAEGNPDFEYLQDEELIAQAQAMLTNQSSWSTPKKASDWKTDVLVSALNPTPIDLVMNPPLEVKQDYGFFTFTGKPMQFSFVFSANPHRGVLLRSGEGASYARVHLSSIAEGVYTFDFDVAPAVAK
jgi:hypothetical protein